MREIPFSSLQGIAKRHNGRRIVFFGADLIAEKTMRLLPGYEVEAIADNAQNLWGDIQFGNVEVRNPEFLNNDGEAPFFVIICTTSFAEVSRQLVGFGLTPEEDFVVSPVLNDLRVISELESVKKKLMFSSGSAVLESSKYGGGIYEMVIDGDDWKHEKKISGNCYGIIRYKENFVSCDTERGLIEFDRNYNIVRQKELPIGTRAHGVAYSEMTNCFYIVGSYMDAVLELDADSLEIKDTIHFSNKRDRYHQAHHHCNDCCVVGTSLYVSMFSYTGNWKKDIFDGAVVEIDLTTKTINGPIIQNLSMPHNISYHGGGICVLDSLPGYLRKNNASVVGEFSAFTRGLDFDGIYFYIGQSRNRNFSKNLGVSNNISIDTAIVIFDEHTKVSRSLHLPSKLSEIHSIVLI